jgi:phage-related protein
VAENDNPRPVEIAWEGDSYDVLKSWPKPIRIDFGISLREMQSGKAPLLDTRRMASVGDGVYELKDSDEATWYRMMYLKRIGDVIHILDCFEKDTAKTERKDLNRATTRLQKVLQRIREEKQNAKHQSKKQAGPRNKR